MERPTKRTAIVESLRLAGSDVPGAEALLAHLSRSPSTDDLLESDTSRINLATIYRRRLRHVRANGFLMSRFVGLAELVAALERASSEDVLLSQLHDESYSAIIVRSLDGSFIGCVHGPVKPPLTKR